MTFERPLSAVDLLSQHEQLSTSGTLALSLPQASLDARTLDGDAGFLIPGLSSGDELGWFVRGIGDWNGDGIDDFVVGAPFAQRGLGPSPDPGSAYVLFGNADMGAGGHFDLTTLDGSNGFAVNGIDNGDEVGSAVETADINNDGTLDLIVGAPATEASFGRGGPGSTTVIFGKAALGSAGVVDLAAIDPADQLVIHGLNPAGSDSGDRLGERLAVGDLNNDGIDDLVMSASFATPNGLLRQGATYVLFGTDEDLPTGIDADDLAGGGGLVVPGLKANDLVSDVAVGDVNGDGIDDLVIAANGVDSTSPNLANVGAVYVIFGTDGLNDIGTFSLASLDGSNGFTIRGTEADQEIAGAVAANGDVNGDGYKDIVFASGELTEVLTTAEAHVLFGASDIGSSGEFLVGGASSIVASGAGIRITGLANDSFVGVGLGDVTGDGIADVLLNGQKAPGHAFALFGHPDLADSGTIDLKNLPINDGVTITNTAAGAVFFPNTIDGIGDVNDDGVGDFIVGAPPFQGGTLFADPGQATVVFGPPQATLVVNTLDDVIDASDGKLSLREAITQANEHIGADTITFADSIRGGTIDLDRGALPTITDDVMIDGDPADSGPSSIAIRSTKSGVIDFDGVTAKIEDLQLLDGAYGGGALLSSRGSDLTFERVYASAPNHYTGDFLIDGGSLHLAGSTIDLSSEGITALLSFGSDIVVTDSTIRSDGAYAVGIAGSGSLELTGSTVVARGGRYGSVGVSIDGKLTVLNSTIDAVSHYSPVYEYPTIANAVSLLGDSTSTITNATITGSATGSNPAIWQGIGIAPTATLVLTNSLVVGDGTSINGTFTDGGGNVIGTRDGVKPGDVFATDSPVDNGGPTPTIALLDDPGNPALNGADAGTGPNVDQRGFPRVGTPDAGAFEVQEPPLFIASGQPFPTDSSIAVALADLDGDGDVDAYVSNRVEAAPGFDRVLLNDGHGRFVDSGQQIAVDNAKVATGDLNGDGTQDVFAAVNQPPGIPVASDANIVLLNDGNGKLTDTGQRLGMEESADVALGDVDGNGTLDAVVGNLGGDNLADRPANLVWLNDGTGTFTDSGQQIGMSSTRSVALGDLDGNGSLDLFTADADGDRVYLNANYDGIFTDTGQVLGRGFGFDVALADLDGNGTLDAYVANGDQDEIWLNRGDGTFDLGQRFVDQISDSAAVALGDIDLDGDIDAFVVSALGFDRVLLNRGDGTLQDSGLRLGESSANSVGRDIGLADVDGDGDLDAFVANNGVPVGVPNVVWFNQTISTQPLPHTVPDLAEGHRVPVEQINGVDAARLVVGASGDAAISFVDEHSAFVSMLGVYLVGDDGTIHDPMIVFPEIEHADAVALASGARPGGGPLSGGETVLLSDLFDPGDLAAGTQFGLFLLVDGFNLDSADLLSSGHLAFRDGAETATLDSDRPSLVHIADDATETVLRGDIMHVLDADPVSVLTNVLNPLGSTQALSGLIDGDFTIGFEDLRLSKGDGDFNDVLVAVDNAPAALATSFAVSVQQIVMTGDEALAG